MLCVIFFHYYITLNIYQWTQQKFYLKIFENYHLEKQPRCYCIKILQIIRTVLKKGIVLKQMQSSSSFNMIMFQTCVVVSERFGTNTLYRFSADKSFCIFSPFHPIRKFAITAKIHPLVLNCLVFASFI